jgi:hypothetical protein
VIGIFDAPSGIVTASRIEKISGPPTPTVPLLPADITWSISYIATLFSITATIGGAIGWIVKKRSAMRRRRLVSKLLSEIDNVYSRFKTNASRCEIELYRLKDQVLDEFKRGRINEANYNVLDKRIDDYMKEVREQIIREQTRKLPKQTQR